MEYGTLKCWVTLAVLTTLANTIRGAKILQGPEDVATVVGSDVTFRCDVENDTQLSWAKILTSGEQEIWNTLEKDKISDKSKYNISGMYNLDVLNTTFEDGTRYSCRMLTGEKTKATATLLVFDHPSCGSQNLTYVEGDNVTLFCHTFFGGEVTPNVTFRTGDSPLLADLIHPSKHQITAEVKFAASAEDNGNVYVCDISTYQPRYEDNCTLTLAVQYYPKNVTFHPDLNVYYEDEEIVCNATGNPQPSFWWQNLNETADVVHGDVITLNSTMIGFNRWRCVATSSINGLTNTTSAEHEFTVIAGSRTNTSSAWSLTSSARAFILLPIIFFCSLMMH